MRRCDRSHVHMPATFSFRKHTNTQTQEYTHVYVLSSTEDGCQTSTPVEKQDNVRHCVACVFAEPSTSRRPTPQMERLRSMIKNRKLALVLDLDHTLLHTTMPRSPYQVSILQRICGISDEVFQVCGCAIRTQTHPSVCCNVLDLLSWRCTRISQNVAIFCLLPPSKRPADSHNFC
jgi:hypothetical protein